MRNPRYVGAYAFGKTRFRKKLDARGGQSKLVPREQWHSLIRDAHPGYISWQDVSDMAQKSGVQELTVHKWQLGGYS